MESWFTYELNVVDFLVLELFQCFHGIPMQGEGYTLEGLLFGVHADVRGHLRTAAEGRFHFTVYMSIKVSLYSVCEHQGFTLQCM